MHTTLSEHARCLYGDEFRPVPACDREHEEHYFVEELTFADADSILSMLRELGPHMVESRLPQWVRNLAYRLLLLQRPDDPTLMREAADSLYLHGPVWDDIAADLRRRADALEAAPT
ncbi:hypothetical protein WEB32_04045 [Streptomyces netropsis]|uniref:Uncharacterized protein n=1 Tax=Streptomyces netropsis TaxID=55404 RepID=A0A7W7LBV1_STRNE|nr:hypothetical protein [Streptomyces netropsis]MBB4887352.1 hypothetical protein [Streptomyces netropsis]GGR09692.1 hypothetical protein GCM10010219_12810 [Streptomyces netropsis]